MMTLANRITTMNPMAIIQQTNQTRSYLYNHMAMDMGAAIKIRSAFCLLWIFQRTALIFRLYHFESSFIHYFRTSTSVLHQGARRRSASEGEVRTLMEGRMHMLFALHQFICFRSLHHNIETPVEINAMTAFHDHQAMPSRSLKSIFLFLPSPNPLIHSLNSYTISQLHHLPEPLATPPSRTSPNPHPLPSSNIDTNNRPLFQPPSLHLPSFFPKIPSKPKVAINVLY